MIVTFSAAPSDSSIPVIVGSSVGGLIAVVLAVVTEVVAVGLLLKLKSKCEWTHYVLIVPLNQAYFIYCQTLNSGHFWANSLRTVVY